MIASGCEWICAPHYRIYVEKKTQASKIAIEICHGRGALPLYLFLSFTPPHATLGLHRLVDGGRKVGTRKL